MNVGKGTEDCEGGRKVLLLSWHPPDKCQSTTHVCDNPKTQWHFSFLDYPLRTTEAPRWNLYWVMPLVSSWGGFLHSWIRRFLLSLGLEHSGVLDFQVWWVRVAGRLKHLLVLLTWAGDWDFVGLHFLITFTDVHEKYRNPQRWAQHVIGPPLDQSSFFHASFPFLSSMTPQAHILPFFFSSAH